MLNILPVPARCISSEPTSGEIYFQRGEGGEIFFTEYIFVIFRSFDAKILFAPAKAANAGGVGMSGLEMSQNSERRSRSNEELSKMLRDLMTGIHNNCHEAGNHKDGWCNYMAGSNIAGFKKVADAMMAFGVV